MASETEDLLVLYHLHAVDPADTNAFRLRVFKGKEVYLLDVLHYLAQTHTLAGGTHFDFFAVMSPPGYPADKVDLVPLCSPASVVPVVDDVIQLLLLPTGASPTTPVGANSPSQRHIKGVSGSARTSTCIEARNSTRSPISPFASRSWVISWTGFLGKLWPTRVIRSRASAISASSSASCAVAVNGFSQ